MKQIRYSYSSGFPLSHNNRPKTKWFPLLRYGNQTKPNQKNKERKRRKEKKPKQGSKLRKILRAQRRPKERKSKAKQVDAATIICAATDFATTRFRERERERRGGAAGRKEERKKERQSKREKEKCARRQAALHRERNQGRKERERKTTHIDTYQ